MIPQTLFPHTVNNMGPYNEQHIYREVYQIIYLLKQ